MDSHSMITGSIPVRLIIQKRTALSGIFLERAVFFISKYGSLMLTDVVSIVIDKMIITIESACN